jgi:hypothetical protein
MANPTAENEVLSLEKQYWQAVKDGDVETCLQLTADPCIVAGPNGVATVDHDQLAKMMKKPSYRVREFQIDDPQFSFVDDDVCVVAYKVHEDLEVGGEARSVDANDSSTWVRRDGHWLCAMHTEAIAGDPFARREAASERPDLS